MPIPEELIAERMSDNPWHDYDELTRNGWVYQNGEYVKAKPAVGETTKDIEKY